MQNTPIHSVVEQVTEILRKGIFQGRWRGTLPGRNRLAKELGVNHKTVETAAQRLIREGLLVAQKPPLRRRIVLPAGAAAKQLNIHVRLLPYDSSTGVSANMSLLLEELRQMGFKADFARKSLSYLGMCPDRVARFVSKAPADAWIIESASHGVLKWFTDQQLPAMAISGRFTGLPIAAASPQYAPAMALATRRLYELGHRRIVMLVREERRSPRPAIVEQAFLETLESLGIRTGDYNLPYWQNDAAGLQACLKSLFSHTPPTALILGDNEFLVPINQRLGRMGLHAPEHFSLICPTPDRSFAWCNPTMAHFNWNPNRLVRPVRNWAKKMAHGQNDTRQNLFDVDFVEGGSIGPTPAQM